MQEWWRDLVPCQKIWLTKQLHQEVDYYQNVDTFESREGYDDSVILEPGDEVMILESGIWWKDNPWETPERCPLALFQRGDKGYLFFIHEQVLRCGYFSQTNVMSQWSYV